MHACVRACIHDDPVRLLRSFSAGVVIEKLLRFCPPLLFVVFESFGLSIFRSVDLCHLWALDNMYDIYYWMPPDTTTTQENFLLKPRTPEELLTFCRRTLGLEFPSDSPAAAAAPPVGNPPENTETDKEEEGGTERVTPPRTRGNLGGDSTSRGSTSSSAADNNKGKTSDSNSSRSGSRSSGSSSAARNTTRQRRIIDEAAVAVDVARAVLAWGKPFRNIETAWRAAAAGQSYSVAAAAAAAPSLLPPRSLPPRVSTLVLCSARKVLKGEPSPFLRPGTVGPPLAVDVTVEDVRWLKDEWDTSW